MIEEYVITRPPYLAIYHSYHNLLANIIVPPKLKILIPDQESAEAWESSLCETQTLSRKWAKTKYMFHGFFRSAIDGKILLDTIENVSLSVLPHTSLSLGAIFLPDINTTIVPLAFASQIDSIVLSSNLFRHH